MLRLAAYLTGGLLSLAIVMLAIAAWVYRDIPAEVLEARYAAPSSLFINLEGVRMHFQDQGTGQPIVLIHGEMDSLFAWNPWVRQLQKSFRLLRFDLPGHGLTGPDPGGDYSIARSVDLLERFAAARQLNRFSIAATSSGATIAVHYAALHPDQIVRLVLLNPELPDAKGHHSVTEVGWMMNLFRWITPRSLTEYVLRHGFGNAELVTDALVNRWHDFWLRDGQRGAIIERLHQHDTSGIAEAIARITAPALIIWGGKTPSRPIEIAGDFVELFNDSAKVDLIIYPEAGDLIVLEAPDATAQDALEFFRQPAGPE